MPENDAATEDSAGEPESSSNLRAGGLGGLWGAIRRAFGASPARSLREQIEDVLDAHEKGGVSSASAPPPSAPPSAPTSPSSPSPSLPVSAAPANATSTPGPSTAPQAGDLSETERQMLRNLLHFSDHDADDVSVPRGEIEAVSADVSWSELIAIMTESGHSRMPVYRDQLDSVIGMIHIKDVFPYLARKSDPPKDWTILMRQPLYVPPTRGALDVLADMRARRTHLAIVVDEFSGTDGLISIEDLVEEIVGEIEDEHDDLPEEMISPIGEGMWDCDARAELDDVAQRIDSQLAQVKESVDTLGGLAYILAQQVPSMGAIIRHPSGWHLEIIAADETHVKRIRLHPPAGEKAAQPAA